MKEQVNGKYPPAIIAIGLVWVAMAVGTVMLFNSSYGERLSLVNLLRRIEADPCREVVDR